MRIFGLEMQKALLNAEIMVSVDIETTGFSPDKGAEIIEIGASMINTKTKKILKNFSELVKPRNGKIPNKIIELTHITNEMVRDKRFIEPVIEDLGHFMGDYPLVFHNAYFDWDRFLEPLFKKRGIYKNNDIIDTLTLTGVCLPDLKKKNLGYLCSYFGYKAENLHRALDDAKATGALCIKYKEILSSRNLNIKEAYPSRNKNTTSLPELRIKSINCWGKGGHRRIYILTSWGNLYYDLNKKNWYVANTSYDATINFKTVEAAFLKAVRINSINEIGEYFKNSIEGKNNKERAGGYVYTAL